MTASERIELVLAAANKLHMLADEEIGLILGQFSIPTTEYYNHHEKKRELIGHIQQATDDELNQLAIHLGVDVVRRSPTDAGEDVVSSFWKQDSVRLFISHKWEDRQIATDIQAALEPNGIACFVAHRDIEPTREWALEIEAALSSCHALCALLTPKFRTSYWTDHEVGMAHGLEKMILPIRLGIDPYGMIGRFQGLPGFQGDARRIASEIFERLKSRSPTEVPMQTALVAAFERSTTFAHAKRLMDALETMDIADVDLADRIERAVDRNDQIEGAWGIPSRARTLAAQIRKKV